MSAYRESIASGGAAVQRDCWLRRIRITFESKGNAVNLLAQQDEEFLPWLKRKYPGLAKLDAQGGVKLVINDDFNIRVSGVKNLGLIQDNGVIEISNITYDSIALIIALKLYRVTIEVGYKNNDTLFCVAKGEVSWLQQKVRSKHDYNLYITYASELVASWSQNRINFSMQSGCNLADMTYWMFLQQGLPAEKILIDDRLRRLVAKNILANSGTATDIMSQALGTYSSRTGGLVLRSDSSLDNNVISITDIKNSRKIRIDPEFIYIGNGNPTVTANNGLRIQLFPVYNLIPGDIIIVPNRLIDTSSGMTTAEGVQNTFNQHWLNPDGAYIIREINYTFENRGETFRYDVRAIPLNLYQTITGGS